MQLRPRQKIFVDKCVNALNEYGDTLGVACVGFGKTYSMSVIIDKMMKIHGAKKVLVLQHRTELKEQNKNKFDIATNSNYKTSFIQGAKKDTSGKIVFGMIQTAGRMLDLLPKFDLVVIDEAHRSVSKQYMDVLKHLRRQNSNLKILGVTATPNRGDGKGLGKVFSNVADVVSIEETIASGHLVSPRTYSLDMGQLSELMNVKKIGGEYDQDEVADILSSIEITKGIIKYWKELALDRKTIAFCPTVEYAKRLQAYFESEGIETALVHGGLTKKNRREQINKYENGTAKIMFNVAVFTEGYDYPPTSCIILLRQSSYQGTMIQMIGRGLRTVNENEYPDVNKIDCVVLDFGISTSLHGTIESSVNLEDRHKEEVEIDLKNCASCFSAIPSNVKICPICGFAEEERLRIRKEELKLPVDFNLIEVNMFDKFPYQYEWFDGHKIWVCSGFDVNTYVVKKENCWKGYVREKNKKPLLIKTGSRQECFLEVNKKMRELETTNGARKNKKWLNYPVSEKQNNLLLKFEATYKGRTTLNRYKAACLLHITFYKKYL